MELTEGSQIDFSRRVKLEKYNAQREKLLNDGDIIADKNGVYILKVSLEFNTPSGASDFVLGGSTNGWIEWKNREEKTLDEIYRK